MAIASIEPDSTELPGIILVAIRATAEDLTIIEKTMRQKGLSILQKKGIEENHDSIKDWFYGDIAEDVPIIGYVIQGQNVEHIWKEVTEEFGGEVCGLAPDDELRRLFPSVVLDDYLLQPSLVSDYLHQLKPTLLAGLQDVCDKKPEDPVQHLALYLKNACSS